jgi:DNA-binding Xre family transcriptional regulator
MSSTASHVSASFVVDAPTRALPVPVPVIAEVDDVRLLLHLRELRGSRSLREAAALVGMNRDELGRIERGETKQIHFRTLAKLLVAYRCNLDDLLEVDVVPASRPTPLYAGVVAALSAGTLPGDGPRRRSVRRSTDGDVVNEGDEDLFAASNQADHSPSRRRRAPVGTLNR